MKIKDFLSKDCIKLELEPIDKKEHIKEMVKILCDAEKINKNKIAEITEKLIEREEMGSTGIGKGVSIPHIKTEYVNSVIGALGVSSKGVNFDSLDGEPVYISFLLITPIDSTNENLKALSEISHFLKDKYYREELRAAKNIKVVYKLIKRV